MRDPAREIMTRAPAAKAVSRAPAPRPARSHRRHLPLDVPCAQHHRGVRRCDARPRRLPRRGKCQLQDGSVNLTAIPQAEFNDLASEVRPAACATPDPPE